MGGSFDIVLSRRIAPEEAAKALAELLPGRRIDVARTWAELPDEPGILWATIEQTLDPDWPCSLNCVCRDEPGLGACPELRVADWLCRQLGINCLCGVYPFAGDIDPHDPYWWLACVGGEWHLADADGSRLMGPYTDGARTFPGDQAVRLVRPVALPEGVRAAPRAAANRPRE